MQQSIFFSFKAFFLNCKNLFLKCSFHFSFNSAKFKTPSPGAYYPEAVHPQGERHAPRYSIGFRSRYRKEDQNPAPNSYLLPTVMGPLQPYKESASSYSMTGTLLSLKIEPRREKTGLRGFRPGPTQTGLYKLRKELEA